MLTPGEVKVAMFVFPLYDDVLDIYLVLAKDAHYRYLYKGHRINTT
jgi:hypothetical protein